MGFYVCPSAIGSHIKNKNVEHMCMSPIKSKSSYGIFPCGQCVECLSSKRSAWTIRLMTEEKYAKTAYFVTLTYTDETIPLINLNGEITRGLPPIDINSVRTLQKTDLQKYFKRLRKTNPQLKYYAVGEYGEKTHRPHYHAIIFNANESEITESWKVNEIEIGSTFVGKVTPASINYCTGYIINKAKYRGRQQNQPFAIMSKGLGKAYVSKAMQKYHKENFKSLITTEGGQKHAMPRYLKEKIFGCETAIKLIGIANKIQAQKEQSGKEVKRDDKGKIEQWKYKREIASRNKKFNQF